MNEWVRFSSHAPRVRIIAFHPAGGSASYFRALAAALPGDIELWAYELPGRGRRLGETAYRHMDELIAGIGPSLLAVFQLPTIFLGHSLGGYVAYESCMWLRDAAGFRPRHLVISSAPAPQTLRPPVELLSQASDERLVEVVAAWGGDESTFSEPEFRELMLPSIRADVTVFETYRPSNRSPLLFDVTAWVGSEDEARGPGMHAWSVHARSFRLIEVAGGHDHLRTASAAHVESLVSIVAGMV